MSVGQECPTYWLARGSKNACPTGKVEYTCASARAVGYIRHSQARVGQECPTHRGEHGGRGVPRPYEEVRR